MPMQTSSNTVKQGKAQTREDTLDEKQMMEKGSPSKKIKKAKEEPKKPKAKEGIANKMRDAVKKMFKKKKGK